MGGEERITKEEKKILNLCHEQSRLASEMI
jgi:hypothetical protein